MRVSEAVGTVSGWLLAPVTGTISWMRQARMFHPEGTVLRASIVPIANAPPWSALAERLAGPALVRLSTALWRGGREWPDALGLAVRTRADDTVSPLAAAGDQDLLLATIKHPWTTPFAPLTTRAHDYLANDYYAVSPFTIDGIAQRVYFRLVRPVSHAPGRTRFERLERAVTAGDAVFRLEVARAGRLRNEPYAPVAELRLRDVVDVDQATLRFDPFRDGKGIRPRGFVHTLRVGAYRASQRARPEHE